MPNCKQVACILDFTMVLATNRLNTQFQHSIKAVKTEIMFDFEVVRFLEKNTNRRDFPHFPLKFDSLLYRPSLPRGSIFFVGSLACEGTILQSRLVFFSCNDVNSSVLVSLVARRSIARSRSVEFEAIFNATSLPSIAYTTGRHCKNDCTFP